MAQCTDMSLKLVKCLLKCSENGGDMNLWTTRFEDRTKRQHMVSGVRYLL